MSIEEFYNDIKSKKKSVKNNELSKLYQRPVKETGEDAPKWQVLEPNWIHQADTLYMPEDTYNKKKYRYVLVVADVCTKMLDAEPIDSLRQDDHCVLNALKTIYSRGILKYPHIIMFDNGNENKDRDIEKFMRSHRINMRFMVPARYRQISTVKTAKRKIGSILHKRMASEELVTGEVSRQWVSDLAGLVKAINKNLPPPITKPETDQLLGSKFGGNIIPIGTRVRVQLDHPQDTVKGNYLPGKFRSSDIRWSPDVTRVEQVLLKPGFPPMYLVADDDKLVSRTKNQLQLVKRNERAPDVKYIRGDPEYAIINSIIDYRKQDRKDQYLVGFKGYDATHNRWMDVKELNRTADLRAMKNEFNANRQGQQALVAPAPVPVPVPAPAPVPVPAPAPAPVHRYPLRSRSNQN
jgi:hypothetical protein